MTVLGVFGMQIGAYFGGLLLPKYGSRKLIIFANVISLAFNALKLVENTACIMVARLIFGIAIGLAAVCLSRAINDTVPT